MQFTLLIFFISAFIIFALPKTLRNFRALILASVLLGGFVFFFTQIPYIKGKNSITAIIHWIPELNLNLEFLLDGLSLNFALLITFIGGLVFIYSQAYMKKYPGTGIFYFFLMLFGASMLGMVLSGNLIQLFIFWELTTFLSFLLISFFHEKEEARKAAFQSLFITGLGGLAMLAGIILVGSVVQSYSISDWIQYADDIKKSHLYIPGFALILIGIFTKSAQFPFHFWLPEAMQAPAPVSSYLHSATMVKAGFFLLLRLNPVFGGTPEWTGTIPLIGVLTMLTGAYFAITRTDIKSILAYTTISALGILVLLVGIDTKLSVKAAMVFLYVHAFYKATLFMVAGYIEKKTGTRKLANLGGLIKYMPVTFGISLLALLSMAGLPPMLGFLGKELIYEAKVQSPGIASVVLILGVMSNILMVAISLYFLKKVFLGKVNSIPENTGTKSGLFLVGPIVLALLSLLLGLFPSMLGNTLVEPALSVIRVQSVDVDFKLWHGFSKVFFLSLFTILAGTGLFIVADRNVFFLFVWRKLNDFIFTVRLSNSFFNAIGRFLDFSKRYTGYIQHGYHRYYILTIVLFTAALIGFQLYNTRGWIIDSQLTWQPFYISGLVLIIILATLFSTVSNARMPAIIAMGVTGYGISLIYLYYSAVDLAITQILVETLIVVMFVLILQRLPRFAKLSSVRIKIRDLFIALSFGSVMTIIALKAIHIDLHHPISDYFLENSYAKAFGKNVVNVILVDFRALDTMGEVTVLTIAAMGITALLSFKTSKK